MRGDLTPITALLGRSLVSHQRAAGALQAWARRSLSIRWERNRRGRSLEIEVSGAARPCQPKRLECSQEIWTEPKARGCTLDECRLGYTASCRPYPHGPHS